jgi:hypothetical protein
MSLRYSFSILGIGGVLLSSPLSLSLSFELQKLGIGSPSLTESFCPLLTGLCICQWTHLVLATAMKFRSVTLGTINLPRGHTRQCTIRLSGELSDRMST